MRGLQRKVVSTQCMVCREAFLSSKRIYCKRLGEYVDNLVYCPYFEPRPVLKPQAI